MLKSKINIRLESFAVLGPLLGGIAGLLLTVAVFLVSRETELKRFHLEFQADASMRARLVEDGLRERFQEVRIIARTMGRKGCFDEGGFRSLGVSLGLDSRGMVGMAWLPVEDPGRAGTIGTRVPREALERKSLTPFHCPSRVSRHSPLATGWLGPVGFIS